MKTLLLIAAYLFTSIIIAMAFVGFAKADDIVSATAVNGKCQVLIGMYETKF